jgi:hypothetical protein
MAVGSASSPPALSRRLVKSQNIPSGITEPSRDLRRIGTDWLHQLSSIRENGINGGGNAVAPDVYQKSRASGRWPSDNPSATDGTAWIVEGNSAIAASSKLPSENRRVKFRGTPDVDSGKFNVTDFTVGIRHDVSVIDG